MESLVRYGLPGPLGQDKIKIFFPIFLSPLLVPFYLSIQLPRTPQLQETTLASLIRLGLTKLNQSEVILVALAVVALARRICGIRILLNRRRRELRS
jgi:hypothetical protein